MTEPRIIATSYLVTSDKGPLVLANKEEAETIFNKAKEKNLNPVIRKIESNLDRLNELGENLFSINFNVPIKELIKFRNNVIKEWQDNCIKAEKEYEHDTIIWKRVIKKHGLDLTIEKFNKSILDKVEYQ